MRRLRRRLFGLFALFGFLLLLAGLGLGWYLFSQAQRAQTLDSNFSGEGMDGACAHPQPVIEVSNRSMSENDTQALRVRLTNTAAEECTVSVTLNAPNFDLGGTGSTQSVVVPAEGTATLSWIIAPKKVGTFEVTAQGGLDTAVAGLTVLNVLGLSASQLQLLSLLSTFLGPMLSAPWWFELFRSRSRRR